MDNYLSNIKSSGIYRFVWDKSEIPGVEAETLRLVVGYSEKGPFNTPVYVKSANEFKTIFGNRSKKLERNGVWFHRMAIQALAKGPILALNLKPFNDEIVEGVSFNLQDGIGKCKTKLVKDIFNTNRFWTLEPEKLENEGEYISIYSTDSLETSNTIFIRGFQPTGYDISFKDYFRTVLNGEDLPEYIDENHEGDLLSQYFAEIFVFRGQFTPAIASSERLQKYFNVNAGKVTLKPYITNAFGEKVDTLYALSGDEASNFIKSYNGILFPEFLDSNHSMLSLDSQFNNDQQLHKMMMRFNQDMLFGRNAINIDELNTTGWLVEDGRPFMSIEKLVSQTSVATYNAETNEWSYSEVNGVTPDFYEYQIPAIEAVENDPNSIAVEPILANTGIQEGDKFKVMTPGIVDEQPTTVPAIATLTDITTIKEPSIVTRAVASMDPDPRHKHGKFETKVKSDTEYDLMYYFTTNPEDNMLDPNTSDPDKPNGVPGRAIKTISWATVDVARFLGRLHEESGEAVIKYNGNEYIWNDGLQLSGSNYLLKGAPVYDKEEQQDGKKPETLVKHFMEDFKKAVDDRINKIPYVQNHPETYNMVLNTIAENNDFNFELILNTSKAKINFIAKLVSKLPEKDILDPTEVEGLAKYKYTFDIDVTELAGKKSLVKCVGHSTYTSENLVPAYVKGYTYAGGKPKANTMHDRLYWQHDILNVLSEVGIREALTNGVDSDYRYLVDTFEGYVENECKGILAGLCKDKDNVFGILNFPAMKSFEKCDYTSFTDGNGVFNTKFIPTGGNRQKSMGTVFTLPAESNGASWVAFYTPVMIRDAQTGIKDICPSAALVSNNYMDKYTKYQPYTIIAGPNRGVLINPELIGPDFNYSRKDLDNLEPFGVNCLVFVPGRGTYINSNQTAKQNPVTSLSKAHVRELCIFLQDEIEKLLQQYHWDFNTPNLRSTIKDRADVILETAKNNGGVYEYLNVCDTSNNTDEVINNEMFILSTSIEPTMGAGKMVQELTLYRKGGMASLISE